MKPLILAIMTTATLAGCGADKEERNETPGGDNQDTVKTVVADEETSSQVITAQVDDAISAAGEDQESESAAGLMLANADTKKIHKRFRVCNVVDGKAVVELKRSIDRSFTNEGPVRSATTSFTLLDERTRTWAMTDGSVACSDNKKHAVIPWANIQGMTTGVVFNSAKSRESTLTNKKNGTEVSTSHSVKAEGERTISWSNVASESSVIVQKSIVSNVTRELTVVKKDGTSKTLSSNVVISSESPLIIAVERDKTSLEVVSRTINSGKIIATGKDGGRIETKFDSVKYTKENKCMASAGKISGAIYAKDATEATLTFDITFDGESKTIVYSNGKEAEYSPDGCVFDEPEEVTESESKDEVTAVEPAE
jgi:hypothetical protein